MKALWTHAFLERHQTPAGSGSEPCKLSRVCERPQYLDLARRLNRSHARRFYRFRSTININEIF